MKLLNWLQRRRLDREMDAEMRFHVDMEAAELEGAGHSREEARRLALARFGGATRYKEEGQEARGALSLDDLQRDVRYSIRSLLRSPGYAAVVVITLALGIAANAAIYSVANGILFKPLPWRDPAKLLLIGDKMDFWGVAEAMVTGPEIVRLRETRTFEAFAALRRGSVNFGGSDGVEPLQVPQATVSANLFQLLGSGPVIGRGFAPDEGVPGAPRVAVISHRLWMSRFGADSGVVNRTVTIDGNATTVIGVLPAGIRFTAQGNDADVFMPQADTLDRMPPNSHMFMVLGRVRPEAHARDVDAELGALSAKIDSLNYGKQGFRFMTLSLQDRMVRSVRPAVLTLLGAVASLMLIMCANLAVLALVRAARREREITVRRAIGASAGRVTRQIFTETVVLSLAGGALGALLGVWALRGLMLLAPDNLPRRDEIGIDWVVLAVTLGAAIVVGIGMGLAPVYHSLRSDIASVLREKAPTHGRSNVRRGLVVAQVALSMVLLAGTGLLLGSFVRLTRVDGGFDPTGVLRIELLVSRAKYVTGKPVVDALARFNDALRVLPGVTAVGAAMSAPLSAGANQSGAFFIDSPVNTGKQDIDGVLVDNSAATAGWFAATGVQILEGQEFDARHSDSVAARVAIIDDVLAKKYFPKGGAIGQRMFLDGDTIRVWAVARHVRLDGMHDEGRPQVWTPHRYAEYRMMSIMVRTAGDPLALAPAARRALRAVDADQPVIRMQPLTDTVKQSLAERRLVLTLVSAFAAAALLLAALGIYGVTSSSVAARTREMGIRIALGATRQSVMSAVLSEPVRLLALGLALGLAGVLASGKLVGRLLYGMSASDPGTMVAVGLVLLLVGLVASWVPAWRATRVEPVSALRSD